MSSNSLCTSRNLVQCRKVRLRIFCIGTVLSDLSFELDFASWLFAVHERMAPVIFLMVDYKSKFVRP